MVVGEGHVQSDMASEKDQLLINKGRKFLGTVKSDCCFILGSLQ